MSWVILSCISVRQEFLRALLLDRCMYLQLITSIYTSVSIITIVVMIFVIIIAFIFEILCNPIRILTGLPTCTDFRGTYRFWLPITISRFHAVVYRFWKMREFLGLSDFALFSFHRYFRNPLRILHLPPVKALRCRYK